MSPAADTNSLRDGNTPAPRAFLFDLDGVLWDSNRLHAEAMLQTCTEADLAMPAYARLAGLSTPEAFAVVLAENGIAEGLDATELAARKRALFRARTGEIASDHEGLLEALQARRPEFMALVTGASGATADAYLRRLPAGFFDLVITADDRFPSKPAPDAYLAAARGLGVAPDECVVFEDSEAGLAAARAAGARVAHITREWGGDCDGVSCGSDWCARTVLDALRLLWEAPWQR